MKVNDPILDLVVLSDSYRIVRGFVESGSDPPSPRDGNEEGDYRIVAYIEETARLPFSV